MAISWTLIVLGALLQGMQCNANNSSTAAPKETTQSISDASTADSTKTTASSNSLNSTETTPALLTSATQSNKAVTTSVALDSTHTTILITSKGTEASIPSSLTDSSKPTASPITGSTLPIQPTSSVTNAPTGAFTTQVTTNKPETQNTSTTLTGPNNSTQRSSTTNAATDFKPGTTDLNTPATTTSTEAGTTQLSSTQTNPSPSNLTENSTAPITEAPKDSKSTASENPGTTKAQTTASTISQDIKNSTPTYQTIFEHSFDLSSSSTKNHIVSEICNTLGQNMKGNCTARVIIDDKKLTVTVTIYADQMISTENYKPSETDRGDAKNGREDKNTQTTPSTKNGTEDKNMQTPGTKNGTEDKNMQTPGTKNGTEGENKGTIPDTLITIMASCGALVLILCCFAAYCTYHRRSYRKNQQHLTEELQTVENGYHDNPTLEVMEVQPEMQEKKLTMNGEFNDSWIVPIDNLLKEDMPDEEDTHL